MSRRSNPARCSGAGSLKGGEKPAARAKERKKNQRPPLENRRERGAISLFFGTGKREEGIKSPPPTSFAIQWEKDRFATENIFDNLFCHEKEKGSAFLKKKKKRKKKEGGEFSRASSYARRPGRKERRRPAFFFCRLYRGCNAKQASTEEKGGEEGGKSGLLSESGETSLRRRLQRPKGKGRASWEKNESMPAG